MPPPDRKTVRAATEVLRREATEWEEQACAARQIAQHTAELELGRVEAGLFQMMVSPYHDVVTAVTRRCQEGSTAMAEIGKTLRAVADTYDREDRDNEHRIRGIY